MMNRTFMTVSVAGGTQTENDQMVAMIHTFLHSNGFTNVNSARHPDSPHQPGLTLADQIRSYNPELFDTPIHVSGECDEALSLQEDAALLAMMPQGYNRFSHASH